MQFVVKRDILLKSLNFVQGVVEKKNTLPILSNVLLQLKDNKLSIVATDLDIVFYNEISDVKIIKEGSTTTSAAILYDILRKISSNSELNFDLKSENKLSLKSDSADFNLLCLPTDNFPSFADEFEGQEIALDKNRFLKLLNKTRISISNDDTRHYLNGVFLHLTEAHGRNFLTGVATDSHRLSSSSLEIENSNDFSSLILPRKTVFQLCSLLSETSDSLTMQSSENKIKFTLGKIRLISKVIDGKFPDYKKVVPATNDKILNVPSKEFINSIERVTSVSLDRKEGVKLMIDKDNIQLSVNSANSGEGNEKIKADYNSESLHISFNSKYLIDIASEIENKNLKMNLKDSTSPVLIEDASDKNSYYVIMPMKI
ncbi:DNA polymerase III subunit beta [Candidatus Pelagibacter bacterium]|nr:DNA polymerase III subunit beta [Candidatus Pelagibacter bacterium]MDA8676598.1 DNA polymerase III subunit beta [Candidatus Pelagibacter bacterium]MDA8764305.1 DNA polymerase III subunit beta [Candidatus Pelagibacter bacterium]MDA8772600.1 DNA polymerase III subunit beta [Candidatus Pelagibacter bacterium]MDC1125211.1 DNA polymerase III subunit beta [Pelagibacteraceae bacterium]